jgi:hypothetical protein
MKMLNVLQRTLATLGFAAMLTCAWAQEQHAPVVTSRLQKEEATVKSIDYDTREVSVEGKRGVTKFKVDPAVKRFDNVRIGDTVIVSYYQGIAAQLAKGDTKVAAPAGSTFAYRGKGPQPSGGAGASVTATVTIEAINTTNNTVVFKRSDGSTDSIAVKSPNMQEFIRTLKPGDNVDVTYTESIAVSVVPKKAS